MFAQASDGLRGLPRRQRPAFRPLIELVFASMDNDWLEHRLHARDSIEGIAREVGRHPSTVSHWVNKHGLRSGYVQNYAPRSRLTRDELLPLVEAGLSVRQIAATVDRSPTTVRHWLRRHGLKDATRALCAARWIRRYGTHAGMPAARMDVVPTRRHRDALPVLALLHRSVADGSSRRWLPRRAAAVSPAGTGLHRRAAVPPRQPGDQALRAGARRRYAFARPCACGGREVRPPVRELPHGGRARLPRASRKIRERRAQPLCWVAQSDGPG